MAKGTGLNYADLYGASPLTPKGEPTTTAAATAAVSQVPNSPALWWFGVIIFLVALRLVYEMAPSAVPGE